ncbi:Rne/Rng family ribonuclease [Paenibacillus tarimensis]|uniref:Rne/Rng family ribonuclease n=1 Tax=Paenibacillus tarimensis TaxID=416012 RepID=UPI001F161E69|nr:Rne/Rng family ribonuclease [Paenibacillus tarimensis]MCF2943959.1 Rne/Rng family ribonuclease [Paenibacillus tarimensis]
MKQMLVHVEREVVQTAVLTDGRLEEYYTEQAADGQTVGSVYKGRIVNVLPGMDAAFVDIGQGKNAFLHIDDLLHPNLEQKPREKPPIEKVVRPGQDILVQIMKEPIGGKGARVTTHYSLPGRWLVYMPYADYVGVSKKIPTEGERARLRQAGESIRQAEEGIILRTAAAGEGADSLARDVAALRERWASILKQADKAEVPAVVHREAGLMQRVVRDILDAETDEIWIDNSRAYEEVLTYIRSMAPAMEPRLKVYRGAKQLSLFEKFGVNTELDKAFAARIRLPSGAELVWDQTEALTVIDVNTSRYTGSKDLEETVYKTNMEAAEEVARLLRLRDAGGIIIIDFIDMDSEEHRQQVMGSLEALVRRDRTKCHVVGWTKLGLLEMTRKKVRGRLAGRYLEPCAACKGRGTLYVNHPSGN